MIDPITFGAAAGIAIGFVNSVGVRISQAWIPSQFDRAQLTSVELTRLRLRQEEERFHAQIRESRERLYLEHALRLEQAELAHQLNRWPLPILPSAFIRRSAANGERALNVIVRLSDHRSEADKAKHGETPLHLIKKALAISEYQMLKWYSIGSAGEGHAYNGVLLYADYRLYPQHDIQSLVTILSSLLGSEPTVLLGIGLCDNLTYRLSVSHWGEACGDRSGAVSMVPASVSLASEKDDPARSEYLLSTGLSSLMAGLADCFHLLRRPHDLPEPVLPRLMTIAGGPDAGATYWKPVADSYLQALRFIGSPAPLMAAEVAAAAASAAMGAGQQPYADRLLREALDYFSAAIGYKGDDAGLLSRATAAGPAAPAPRLRSALAQIRGIQAQPAARSSAESAASLDGLLARLGPASADGDSARPRKRKKGRGK